MMLMTKIRKTASVVLIFLMVFAFTACGKSDKKETTVKKNYDVLKTVSKKKPDTKLVEARFFADEDNIFIANDNDENMKSLFLKGVNIGLSEPETDLSAPNTDYETYLDWFKKISEMNANTIKVFTVMPETFYHALYNFNLNSKTPLYLFQGIWFNEDYMYSYADAWDKDYQVYNSFCKGVTETVDIVHGNSDYTMYDGKNISVYKYDVSKWLVGYILGLEWDYNFVENTNTHTNMAGYSGEYISTKQSASAFETFLCKVGDKLISFETKNYNYQTPIAFLNWSTTDPLTHSNEPFEEEDKVSVDTENIVSNQNYYCKMFAAVDAYPYYPEFLNYQPEYVNYTDEDGNKNPYRAYLNDLKKHYSVPLLIAEFGVPTSRGVAHESVMKYNQGGISEKQQGEYVSNMMLDIARSGCAGGMIFSWQDEWFKQTWNTVKYSPENPKNRTPNVMSAEQSYGILGYTPSADITIDGDFSEWKDGLAVASNDTADMYMNFDETYLYICLKYKDNNALKDKICVSISTVALGSQNNSSAGMNFDKNADFCLVIDGKNNTKLLCDAYYNVFEFIYAKEKGIFKVSDNFGKKNSGEYSSINQFLSNEIVLPLSNKTIEPKYYESGFLKYAKSSENSLADFYSTENCVEIRLPWYLLGVLNSKEPTALGDFCNAGEICYTSFEKIYAGIGTVDVDKSVNLNDSGFEKQSANNYSARLKDSYNIIKENLKKLEGK